MSALLRLLPFVFILSLFSHQAYSFHAPLEIGGIKLGTKIEDYPDVQSSNYLQEVVVTDWHGFRKGILYVGTCESPGTIVKLRMKYEDSSKKFFDSLFKRFKKKFGAPHEWKGDSFGIKHVWKWRLKDEEGNIVNLILQHNLKDPNQNIGNLVKLGFPEMEELERLCFIRKCDEITSPEHKKRKEKLKETNWDYLIPQ